MKKLPPLSIAPFEEEILSFWRNQRIFAKSLEKNQGEKPFSFYDGPPFANGLPHFGHSLVTAIKDAMGRYKTMQGFYVQRRNGWDCHGLPVEYEIEKKFNISGKKEILELGIEKFNEACRESVFTYKKEWEDFFERIGRWTDTQNSYATIDNDYIESVWWVLGQVNQKNLLYRGFKSMPYCPRCETPLSNFELNEGYKSDIEDPSLYVKFKLSDEDSCFLAWTTTPWSLPANSALAVDADADYVEVELVEDGKPSRLILAKNRVAVLDESYKITRSFKGRELVGKSYEPLFELDNQPKMNNLYKVWSADFVSTEDGTGVLHVAPAFGEDDLSLAQKHKITMLNTVDSSGHMQNVKKLSRVNGMFFKGADPVIVEFLTEAGYVFSAQTIEHIYPFCYRCDTPLLYYAVSTWFIRVTSIKKEMLNAASSIEWVPAHVKDGRFGKWLEGARDWAISRNRYWGAPMPVWVNENDPEDYIVVGSFEELKQLTGSNIDLLDLHRPAIDNIVITKNGKTYRRIEEVIDCWFESGSMPYAQVHYPFENQETFMKSFPADYVGEGLDQTRLWFYVLHVLSTILKDSPAYKNVIVNGMILASDGQKLSKRLKNYPPIEDVFSHEGADSLRYYLLSSSATAGDYMRFSRDALKDVSRNVFATLYNTASFYSLYSEIDGWRPKNLDAPQNLTNPLDIWLMARLNQTIEQVTKHADLYDIGRATRPLSDLIEDLSNWYVRRSRRRFWKSENDSDKTNAYQTLFYTLTATCQLFAPWCPFLSEYIYRAITSEVEGAAESVHLTSWPKSLKVDSDILEQMKVVRQLVNDGLSKRAEAGIKVRQPLGSATICGPQNLSSDLRVILSEEINVKTVIYKKADESQIQLDTNLTDDLKQEGMVRDVVRFVQQTRKNINLNVDDRISITFCADESTRKAIEANKVMLSTEVLANEINFKDEIEDADNRVKIGQGELGIKIKAR